MKTVLKRIMNEFYVTQRLYLNLNYYRDHQRFINFKDPRTFTEKIQWAKLYGNLEKLSPYVDKFEVRDYIKSRIGANYLIPLIDVYKSVDEFDINSLPKSFILKATHSAGQNLIIYDKQEVEKNELRNTMRMWLDTNYYHITGEKNYKHIKPKVIAEEIIDNKEGLKDYKFYCFYGEVKFVQVISDRDKEQTIDYLDLNWNPIDLESSLFKKSSDTPIKPKRFSEMVEISRGLSEKFPFVRVDLYDSNERVYFGELTFTPANGRRPYKHIDQDLWLGSLIDKKDLGKVL